MGGGEMGLVINGEGREGRWINGRTRGDGR